MILGLVERSPDIRRREDAGRLRAFAERLIE